MDKISHVGFSWQGAQIWIDDGTSEETVSLNTACADPQARQVCLKSDWPDGQTSIPRQGGEAQGDLLVPVRGVVEAEGRVREKVGEVTHELCARKMCACVRTVTCSVYTSPSRSWHLLLSGRETARKNEKCCL